MNRADSVGIGRITRGRALEVRTMAPTLGRRGRVNPLAPHAALALATTDRRIAEIGGER